MDDTPKSYKQFYKDAWKEHIYGTHKDLVNLNAADDLYWVTYATALQAFEEAHKLAKQGFLLDESKAIYLAKIQGKSEIGDMLD